VFSFTKAKPLDQDPKTPLFTILVADGIVERTNTFRVKGAGFHLKLVNKLPEALSVLDSPPQPEARWDVVFLSGFLGAWNENVPNIISTITRQYKAKKLRSVILTGLIDDEMLKMVKALQAAGVPAAWIPYNYTNPSAHERKDKK